MPWPGSGTAARGIVQRSLCVVLGELDGKPESIGLAMKMLRYGVVERSEYLPISRRFVVGFADHRSARAPVDHTLRLPYP